MMGQEPKYWRNRSTSRAALDRISFSVGILGSSSRILVSRKSVRPSRSCTSSCRRQSRYYLRALNALSAAALAVSSMLTTMTCVTVFRLASPAISVLRNIPAVQNVSRVLGDTLRCAGGAQTSSC